MGEALTRLQKSLRERLEKRHADDALWQGFARAWADECGTAVVADPAAFLAAYAGQMVGFRFALRSTSPATVPVTPG